MCCNVVSGTRSVLFGALVLTLGCLAGCGSEKLDTKPVQGKVVFEKGGTVKKLADVEAAVMFESVDKPGVRATAAIEEDGRLASIVSVSEKEDVASGAGLADGTYRVRLELKPEHRGLVDPRFLTFEKSKITVQVPPPEGEIVIKVWR